LGSRGTVPCILTSAIDRGESGNDTLNIWCVMPYASTSNNPGIDIYVRLPV